MNDMYLLKVEYLFIFFFLLVNGVNPVHAQISHGGVPYSFTHDVASGTPVEVMRPVDVSALQAEDRTDQNSDRPILPRFGTALDVNIGTDNAGRWTKLSNGGRLWRVRISSKKAHAINLIFNRYHLPPGGKLFIYNQDRSTVLGAFTQVNNKPYGRFSTLPVEGALITLEYFEPAEQHGKSQLSISKVIHAYKDPFSYGSDSENGGFGNSKAFGDSESCQININCSEGSSWQKEERAVALVLVDQGTRFCSGALVNNVPEALTPYFLTANHCYTGDQTSGGVSDWIFWFDYESSSCSNPSNEPDHSNSISGAEYKAGNSASDFLLLELSSRPPYSYNTYYAGWDATGQKPTSSTMIHHPEGDVKKISFDNDSATSTRWLTSTPPNSHWELYFDQGANKPGSSGAPYFDQNHRIVGQHRGNLDPNYNGGSNDCQVPHAWGGKFSTSWDYGGNTSTRLKDWLDPNSTGTTKLNGIEGPTPFAISISGPPIVSEGVPETWTASVHNGDGSYEALVWEKREGENGRWQTVCTGSTSCTTSFQGTSSSPSEGSIRLKVSDQGERYYGEGTNNVDIVGYGGGVRGRPAVAR